MISYNRLWETMEKRKISQYRLIKEFGLSSGQMSRLKKNTYVSTHTLETLCRILDCRIEDVMEVSFEDERRKIRRIDTDLYRKRVPIKTRYFYDSFSTRSNEMRTMSATLQFKIRHRVSRVCVDTCSFLRIRWSWPELK